MTPYWTDGRITLHHGNARDILPTLGAKSVDFIFTDPPYGHNNNDDGDLIARWEAALGKQKPRHDVAPRPIANDGQEANELVQWLFGEAKRVLKPGACCCCCCCGGGPDPQFARWSLWLDAALGFKHAVVWDKGGLGMGWHYRRNYEFVLVGQQPGAACKWYGGNNVADVVRLTKIIPSATQHPTEKPVELASFFLQLHVQPGDTIVDPFAGAGSTLVAAKNLGMLAMGIELDERWCELAARKLDQEVMAL